MKSKFHIKATIFDRKGKILAEGQNSYIKSHPMQAKYANKCGYEDKIFLHAEISALVKCKSQGHSMRIERYNRKGEPLLAKPCPICELAIKEHGIKEISYTVGTE